MVGRVTGSKQLFILDLNRSLGFHPRAGCAVIREEWMSAAGAMIPCRPCCPDLPNDSPPHVLHCCPLRRRQTRPPLNHATQLPFSILVNPRRWTTAAIRRWTSLKSAVVQRRILFWDVVPAKSVGSMFFFSLLVWHLQTSQSTPYPTNVFLRTISLHLRSGIHIHNNPVLWVASVTKR